MGGGCGGCGENNKENEASERECCCNKFVITLGSEDDDVRHRHDQLRREQERDLQEAFLRRQEQHRRRLCNDSITPLTAKALAQLNTAFGQ